MSVDQSIQYTISKKNSNCILSNTILLRKIGDNSFINNFIVLTKISYSTVNKLRIIIITESASFQIRLALKHGHNIMNCNSDLFLIM